MVTERVRTFQTEPTDIVISLPLLSFINIGQRGRNLYLINMLYTCIGNVPHEEGTSQCLNLTAL